MKECVTVLAILRQNFDLGLGGYLSVLSKLTLSGIVYRAYFWVYGADLEEARATDAVMENGRWDLLGLWLTTNTTNGCVNAPNCYSGIVVQRIWESWRSLEDQSFDLTN
ncbi:hypothetical protein D9758_003065 [Tetrapyrgos nigripes]|uniref:Uncharacterized protein n=1 Tax=Tetrapyrgos nigripes TaxID=182062 RepID=A0A8H5GQ03_9AGAR|nr:hypothetical protein D9758_003065 [Tetrapyrgos nigripes]